MNLVHAQVPLHVNGDCYDSAATVLGQRKSVLELSCGRWPGSKSTTSTLISISLAKSVGAPKCVRYKQVQFMVHMYIVGSTLQWYLYNNNT
jgi:hypothetical protein